MDSSAFDGIATFFKIVFITLLVSVPLAIWKGVELIIWALTNIKIGD